MSVTVTVVVENEQGVERELELPGKYEVCGRCEGEGKHVDPAIDGNGITAEEWERDWDPEERETYLSGGYDVTCEECGGQRVVAVIDREAMEDAPRLRLGKVRTGKSRARILARVEAQAQAERECEREMAAERAAESAMERFY